MLNIRFIFKMLGAMFVIETLFMLIALGVALFYEGSDIRPFAYSCAILFGVGLTLLLVGWNANEHNAGRREGMLIVTLTWALLSFFGALPFYIGGYIDTMAGAYFETMSGFTTTGSSVISDVEALPRGILFWRSLTQWQGGMGVIVFAVALLPMMGEGASQMFNAESTGITHERFRPRITQVAKRLWGIYVFLTALFVLLLWLGPMDLFDAINHAMTAIATGGFSTKNSSIAYWNSPYIEYTLSLFMCIGATNMTLVYFFLNGKFSKLYKDEEVRWFYAIVLIATLITALDLCKRDGRRHRGCLPQCPFRGDYADFDHRVCDGQLYPLGAFLLDDRVAPDGDLRLRGLDLRRFQDRAFRHLDEASAQCLQSADASPRDSACAF